MGPVVNRRPWAVAVVVPAHDEAPRIGSCLRSVLASLEHASVAASSVVVVADRCNDGTARVAREVLGVAGDVVSVETGNVGAARRVGTSSAVRRLGALGPWSGLLDRVWLLSTDADTIVPARWVASHLAIADDGAAAVAGVVDVDSFVEHPPGTADRFAAQYLQHRDGSHPHVHGANLGVRADAYESVGGWPLAATGEDHRLWDALRSAGWPVVSSIDPRVTTSGRREGRAPDGFARDLRRLAPVTALGPSAEVELASMIGPTNGRQSAKGVRLVRPAPLAPS